MDNQELLRKEIEQNANTVYQEAKDFVCGMEPSLPAATIAFDMLFREAMGSLFTSDWTDHQKYLYAGTVTYIVNQKIQEAFNASCEACEALIKPPVSEGVMVLHNDVVPTVIN